MPATLQVPQGFEPDTIPAGFEPDSVPHGFEPDATTSTATTPTPSVASPVQPGDINQSDGKVQDLQTTTRVEGRAPVASLGETLASLGQESQMTREPGEEPFTGILPRPDGRIGALLRSGSGLEKGIAGGATGAAELVEGVANYLTSKQGIVELGLSKTPVAPAVFIKWAKDMVEGGMIESGEALDAYRRGDMEAFGKHVVGGMGMLLGSASAAKHVAAPIVAFSGGSVRTAEANAKALEASLPPDLKELAPATARATAETIKNTEVQGEDSVKTPVAVAAGEPTGTVPKVAEGIPGEVPGTSAAQEKSLTPATDQALDSSKKPPGTAGPPTLAETPPTPIVEKPVLGGAEADLPPDQRAQSAAAGPDMDRLARLEQLDAAGMLTASQRTELVDLMAKAEAVQKFASEFQRLKAMQDATPKPTTKPTEISSKLAVEPVRTENAPTEPSPVPTVEPTPDQVYDASLETFREAVRAFTKITKAYRAKEIGDAKFLAGRKSFDEAMAVSDAAETKFIAEKNKPVEPPMPTSDAPKAARKPTALQQLDAFVAEHGNEQGWITNPDAFHAQIGKSGDTASFKGRIAKNKAVQAARQNAIRDLNLKPSDSTEPAAVLEKLKAHIRELTQSDNLEIPEGTSTDFLPPEPVVPKLRPGEKGTGSLLQADEPFNLAGEKTVDVERLAKEKQAKEDAAKANEEFQNKNQQDLVGMGGAVKSEFQQTPQTPTSIKNAKVDIERSKRGLPPAMQPQRRKWGTVWDEAMAKIDNDPGYPDRLLTELRDQPRALTDLEDATLLHRQIDLQNEYGKATRDLAQAFDDGRVDAVASERARVNALSDQLLDIYNVGKAAGTATGRGLAARKMMAYEDFTLAKMELEKRAVNDGAPLTDAQRSEVVRLNKRIEDTQKAFDDYVANTETANAERAVKDALAEVERQSQQQPVVEPHVKIIADKIRVYFDNRADTALKRLQGKLFTISPQVLADLTDLGVSRILGGAASFTGWSAKMVEALGEKVKPHLQTVWESSQTALDAHIQKVAGGATEKVKRATRKLDVDEQKTATAGVIKEKMDGGKRDEITPLVQRLSRLFVEQGIKERDPLIDAVHGVLKEIDPEFTRRQTMDAISGYGEFKQLSKDEISKQLRDLKGQMQQVAKLEDMQAGQPPLKTGVERRIPSPEESRLIKKVNEAKNQFQIPIDDPNTQLKSSLDTLKTRLKNRTIELKDKLARGDFEKKPRRIIQMDAEANRLSFEAAKAKSEWHEALMKDRLAKRSVPQKIFAGIGEVMNTSRAILTSMDLSAVLRQGGFIALGHPIRAAKSFPAMFRAFRSEAGQHAVDREIVARKNYPLYNQGKLYLSEHGQKLSQMEEAYMSRWADKIPIVAGSQRAYVTFLNKLRADSFDAMANSLARGAELTPAEANAIGNFVNVATGRGNLGMKENALVGLNTVFFAPRYVASRFQLIAGQPLYRGSARTRIAVAKEYGRFLAGVAIVYGLASLDGATIEQDPRSSDFGKLRYGNTRVDPMAGLLQNTVLLSRLGSGETKRAGGKIVPIRGDKVPFAGDNAADIMARFLRSKLSPAIGTGVNLLTGKDIVGQPVTAESTAESLLIPLAFRDIYKTMIEQGVPRGTAFSVLSIFGMGLQNYDNKKSTANP